MQVLSYQQIVSGSFGVEDVSESRLVKLALQLKENLSVNRMAIAEIALRYCTLRHGGDVKTESFKKYHRPYTVKAFAKKIGIHHHTLSRWTIIKREVFDHLPKAECKDFGCGAGDKVARELRRRRLKSGHFPDSAEVLELYREFSREGGERRRLFDAMSYLGRAVHLLVNEDLAVQLTDEQFVKLRAKTRTLLQRFAEVEKIRKMPLTVVRKKA